MRKPAALLTICLLGAAPALAQQPDLGTDAQRGAGRTLYMEKCAQCHGDAGDAQSYATPFLRPAPRDFTSGTFKFRTTASGELPTTDDIKRSIRNGMPYTAMPAWPSLSEQEVTNLAYFIKTFSDDFSGPFGVPEVVEIPRAPSFDAERAAQRGRELFEENQCYDCHGDLGRGNGKSAPTTEDKWGKHIRPADMTKRWTFRNGQRREDIYRTFTTGLDGSPMPSYDMPVEDRWALVDYVYSLSEDEPNYASSVFAQAVEGAVDLSQGEALFADVPVALFPVVGQVIEPGRSFFPGVNAIGVQAVFNQDDIAIRLTWHDMRAETGGQNSPAMPVPDDDSTDPDTSGLYSDAVAIQLPSQMPAGVERPYFLFGDARNSVDLWHVDLAQPNTAQLFIGKGYESITPAAGNVEVAGRYEEGEWSVIFKRSRMQEDGLSFPEDTFVPIAFTVWDGFNRERGNKRGVTAWYHVYLPPMETESALLPMLGYGLLTLVLGVGLVAVTRRKYKDRDPATV